VLTLGEAVAYALEHSPRLQASAKEVHAAQAKLEQTRAQQRVGLNFQAVETRLGPSISFPLGTRIVTVVPDSRREFALSLNKVFYAGGALRASRRLAELGVEAAQGQYLQTAQEVVYGAVRAYLEVLKAQALRAVAAEAVNLAQEQLRLATVNFEAGTVAKFDVFSARTALANAQQGLLRAENAVELARAGFNLALGRRPTEPVELAPLEREEAEIPGLEESLQLAYAQRPELQILQYNLAMARQSVQLVAAGRRPTIALNANYTRQTATAFAESYSYNASLVVSFPLFDGGQVRASLREARANLARVEDLRRQTEQAIELEVKQALLNLEEARQRILTAQEEVTQAEEGLRVANLRYEAGVSPIIEVQNARLALTQARANLVTATYDRARAEAEWRKATGTYAAQLQEKLGLAR